MKDKLNFKINYKKIKVLEEFNTKDIKFPLVLSIPHSGTVIPKEFLDNVKLSPEELRYNEDSFVDDLLEEPIAAGVPALMLNVARAFIDVNRDKIEIDPAMFFDYPEEEDGPFSRRCRVGLGVIHRITETNKEIYGAPISFLEAQERIKNVYDAYHKKLQQIISKTVKKFGFCFVLDCHSMPSKICSQLLDDKPIEFCLGNLFDQSCPKEVSDFLYKELSDSGYNAVYNCPFSGAFITLNYCQPRKKIYTLQLEINRSLYMREKNHKKIAKFQSFKSILGKIVTRYAKNLLDFKK